MRCRRRLWRGLQSGIAGLVLAGACAPALATCTGLGKTGGNTITAHIRFSSTASTTRSFEQAQGTIEGTGCSTGNALQATPSNGSTTGAGLATRAGGGSWGYQLRDGSNNAVWGNQSSNRLAVGNNPGFTVQFLAADGAGSGFPLAGTYTDTVQVALVQGSQPTNDAFVLTLNIDVDSHCVLTGIAPVNLEYSSFGAGVSREMKFSAACNSPYSISLDANSGTLLGLNYTLSLTPGGSGLGASPGGTEHTVLVTIPAGQAGTCGNSAAARCTGSQVHQMTVTY
jgi:spore coat protein U-like protein